MDRDKVILTKDEFAVIAAMRKVSGFAKFTIEKRPTKEKPEGELIRFVSERSQLVSEMYTDMV